MSKKVYFIFQCDFDGRLENICKIFETKKSAENVLDLLQADNPKYLVVYRSIPTSYAREWTSFFHERLDTFNINADWFVVSPSQIHQILNKYDSTLQNLPPVY